MSEYEFLIMVRNQALERIYSFLEMLNINSQAYRFLDGIKVVTKKMGAYGNYDVKNNVIEINDRLISRGSSAYNDKTLDPEIYDLIVGTIIHEYLHANRVVYINNASSIAAFECLLNNRDNRHNIGEYDKYLTELSDFIGLDNFSQIIPVRINVYKDMKCDVIAYDKNTNQYREYINIDYSTISFNNYHEFLKEISSLLVNIDKYKIIKKNIENIFFSTPDAYILDYEIPEITNLDDEKEILTYIENRTQIQETLEEAFTEGLSRIIVKNPNINNLFDIIEEVSRDEDVSDDALYALRIMQIGREEIISWFMTSAHRDMYIDEFKNFFKEQYDEFLFLLDSISYGIPDEDREYLDKMMKLDNIFDQIEERRR